MIFLLDPLNTFLKQPSFIGSLQEGEWRDGGIFFLSGIICGILWEFWNYWATAKWVYTVPIFGNVKIFEIPVVGYLGFPAFALECHVMFYTVNWVFGKLGFPLMKVPAKP